jgi:hypothetical protein
MRILAVTVVFAGLLCTALPIHSQERWVAFTAKTIDTVDNVDSGGYHTITRTYGIILRSSDGTQLEENYAANSMTRVTGRLTKPSEKTTYYFDYLTHKAFGQAIKIKKIERVPQTEPIGHEIIGGVTATGYHTLDPDTKKPNGEIWFADRSPEIIVRTKAALPDGSTVVRELSDVEIGQEPNPSRMQLPEGFSVSRP